MKRLLFASLLLFSSNSHATKVFNEIILPGFSGIGGAMIYESVRESNGWYNHHHENEYYHQRYEEQRQERRYEMERRREHEERHRRRELEREERERQRQCQYFWNTDQQEKFMYYCR